MPPPPSVVDFTQLLISLTSRMAEQQARLDEDFLRALGEFLPLLKEARAAGYELAVRDLAPSLLTLDSVEIETTFRVAARRGRRAALNVSLLDLGYSRHYSRSGYVRNRLQVSLRRLPAAPGAPTPETASPAPSKGNENG